MIKYDEFVLDNGLQVIVHQDHTTPIAAVNLLYKVGARDENPNKTGFAHLFEHLMFGGSANIPDYDTPLQEVGGENNAFTSNDITNYYITLPVANLETAFWLESDRMMSLSFDPEVLEVQRKVVIEEYKQRYLNPPYGDVWLKLRPLAYQEHPYRWCTIGQEISHIEDATMQDVKDFFYRFYRPNNAVLVVAGDVTTSQVKDLAQKWFGDIPSGESPKRDYTAEPPQTEARQLKVEADVPQDALYKVFPMCARADKDYFATDLLSDVLGRSKSSRLYQELVHQQKLFTKINAYVTGNIDAGLLVIEGRVNDGVDIQEADQAIQKITDDLISNMISEGELQKVKNKALSTLLFSEVELLNRAMNLAYAQYLTGNPDIINTEAQMVEAVSPEDIHRVAKKVLAPSNSSTLYYQKRQVE